MSAGMADYSIGEVQQQRMSDHQDVCWFAALGTCRRPADTVVGVQCRDESMSGISTGPMEIPWKW